MATIYLDHAATSLPKAPGVAEAMTDALALPSPGRGEVAAPPRPPRSSPAAGRA